MSLRDLPPSFPRLASEVYETSDGKLHTSKERADTHQNMLTQRAKTAKLRAAIQEALHDIHHHSLGRYTLRDAMNDEFVGELVKRLERHGLDFKDNSYGR